MAVKIRLRKQGRRNRPFYRLVAADGRSPRDGKYLENLGWYDPFGEGDRNAHLKNERLAHWLGNGALLTEKARSLILRLAPDLLKGESK